MSEQDAAAVPKRPQSLEEWIAFFGQADIPVLRSTAQQLHRLRAEGSADRITDVVADDPFMTLRLLRHTQMHKSRHQLYEIVDARHALLMMGLETFFREVATNRVAEELLGAQHEALAHLMHTVRRAQRAAYYAGDWALRLHDLHAQEVRTSALLSHVCEMLMWCFNPGPMLQIKMLQAADRTQRSADAQLQVLGFSGKELQRRLTVEWQLPELLVSLGDPAQAKLPRVRNVTLAVRLARHSANGWHDAALPDDFQEVARLLHMEVNEVMALVKSGPAAVLR